MLGSVSLWAIRHSELFKQLSRWELLLIYNHHLNHIKDNKTTHSLKNKKNKKRSCPLFLHFDVWPSPCRMVYGQFDNRRHIRHVSPYHLDVHIGAGFCDITIKSQSWSNMQVIQVWSRAHTPFYNPFHPFLYVSVRRKKRWPEHFLSLTYLDWIFK